MHTGFAGGGGHVGVGHVNEGHDGHAGHTGRKFCNPIKLANAPNNLPVARLESTDKENLTFVRNIYVGSSSLLVAGQI